VTGLNAAVAILLALNERTRSGLGQFLDITLYDSALSLLHPHAANFFYSGKVPARTGNAHPNIAPYESLPTGKGEIFLAVGNNRQFAGLAQVLGAPGLAQDERYASNALRLQHRAELREALLGLLARHEAAALADTLLRSGVPAAAVLDVQQALQHPHARHRGMLLEHGEYRGVGSPIKLSRTPATLRRVPPRLETDPE
jgi:crotonobetainyl-CoA:carnitine CoA-transferase CaiB-like acyl-CoA transferase